MLEIKAIAKNEHKVVPDIGDNLKLPSAEQFAVVVIKRHRLMMQTESVKANGKFSIRDFIEPCIKRLDNPPMLNFGKLKRAMVISDIFEVDELEPVFNAIAEKINEISLGGEDKKN
jgi:hypothetical protein